MLRKFSDELVEDREFEIGGEVFEFIYPNWEVGAKQMNEMFNPEPQSENGDPPKFSWVDDTKFAIERIPAYLNPKNDSHKRFKALIARKTDAVPRQQIVQLYKWLQAVTAGLPTTPPSEPDSGGGETDTGSSDVSSSTEETSTA